jgi:hypothetical protein
VLITDGQVGNEDQILRTLGRRLEGIRIFTLGIDQAVNEAFLKRLAGLGGGSCDVVESENRLDEVMYKVHRRIGTPALSRIQVDFRGLRTQADSLVPQRPLDLFAGVPVTIQGRYHGAPEGTAQVRATDEAGRPWTQTVAGRRSAHPAAGVLWARGRIRELEDRYAAGTANQAELEKKIVETSLRFSVLCRFTAYVAVDRSEVVNEGGQQHKVVQAVEAPAGWENSGQIIGMRGAKKIMLAKQVLGEMNAGGRVSKETMLALDDAECEPAEITFSSLTTPGTEMPPAAPAGEPTTNSEVSYRGRSPQKPTIRTLDELEQLSDRAGTGDQDASKRQLQEIRDRLSERGLPLEQDEQHALHEAKDEPLLSPDADVGDAPPVADVIELPAAPPAAAAPASIPPGSSAAPPLECQSGEAGSDAKLTRKVNLRQTVSNFFLGMFGGNATQGEGTSGSAASSDYLTAYRKRAQDLLDQLRQFAGATSAERLRALGILAVKLGELLEDLRSILPAGAVPPELTKLHADLQVLLGPAQPVAADIENAWSQAEDVLKAFSHPGAPAAASRETSFWK